MANYHMSLYLKFDLDQYICPNFSFEGEGETPQTGLPSQRCKVVP